MTATIEEKHKQKVLEFLEENDNETTALEICQFFGSTTSENIQQVVSHLLKDLSDENKIKCGKPRLTLVDDKKRIAMVDYSVVKI